MIKTTKFYTLIIYATCGAILTMYCLIAIDPYTGYPLPLVSIFEPICSIPKKKFFVSEFSVDPEIPLCSKNSVSEAIFW